MNTTQAIKLIEFHQSWLRESGEGESPIAAWRFDEALDALLWAAKQYIQETKDGPELTKVDMTYPNEPEPFIPMEGDTLIAIDPCVMETGADKGFASLTVGKEYLMEWKWGVRNDRGEPHHFDRRELHKYFKPANPLP
jgi:hypothetical protein